MSPQNRHERMMAEVAAELENVPPVERAELLALAASLSDRPVPRPGLRSRIRRELIDASAARPPRARRLALAYLSSGVALLLFAAVGVAGLGPLAS
jgi:hypothetical protein